MTPEPIDLTDGANVRAIRFAYLHLLYHVQKRCAVTQKAVPCRFCPDTPRGDKRKRGDQT